MPSVRRDDFDDDEAHAPRGDDAWRAGDFAAPRPRGWRAIFREGDNPLTWALPLGRYFGIEVRLGLLFVLFIVAEMLRAWSEGRVLAQAQMIVTLFVLVLLHEFGHCFACRRVGGTADEILMWPLGGLASCRPPHHWKAALITTIGGPLVNVALLPVLGGAILLSGGTLDAVVFNPFNYASAWAGYASTWWKGWLWYAYYMNAILLAFNIVVAAFPLDGGRIVQELMWRKIGYRRAMAIATSIGLGAALALGVFGLVAQSFTLMGVAIFCGVTCFVERQRLRFAGAGGESGGEGWLPELEAWKTGGAAAAATGRGGRGHLRLVRDDDDSAAREAAKKKADEEARESAEVDRILAKIAASGLDSLSRSEQRFLRQATNKRRLQ